jgi:hypothetical protein
MPAQPQFIVAMIGAGLEGESEAVDAMIAQLPLVRSEVGVFDCPVEDLRPLEQAQVIISVGQEAFEQLMGQDEGPYTRGRGRVVQWRNVPVVPVYDPTFVRRHGGSVAAMLTEDLRLVAEHLTRDTRPPRPPFQTSSTDLQGLRPPPGR